MQQSDRAVAPEPVPPANRPAEALDKTAAELDLGWGERPSEPADEDDERLLRERPPHWE